MVLGAEDESTTACPICNKQFQSWEIWSHIDAAHSDSRSESSESAGPEPVRSAAEWGPSAGGSPGDGLEEPPAKRARLGAADGEHWGAASSAQSVEVDEEHATALLERLLAKLQSEREEELARTAQSCSEAQQLVSRVRADVERLVEENKPALEKYGRWPSPRDVDELKARGEAREHLTQLADTVRLQLVQALDACEKPATVEAQVASQLDEAIRRLEELRAATAERLREQAADTLRAQQRSTALLAALQPHAAAVDQFVCLCSEQQQRELAQRRKNYEEELARHKAKELKYVQANEIPELNRGFAEVRRRITETEGLLRLLESTKAMHEDSGAQWAAMMERLPKPVRPPSGRVRPSSPSPPVVKGMIASLVQLVAGTS